MTTLPKIELIRRIIIGEMLINSDSKIKAQILKCLLKDSKPAEIERTFNEHFNQLSSDGKNLVKRKNSIKDYVEKNFVNKPISEAMDRIRKNFRNWFEKEYEKIAKINPPIFIDCLDTNGIRPANIDLTLGSEVYVTTEKVPKKLNTMGKDGVVSIEPGEFGILMTHEYLFVPWDLMGYISIRLTHKQKGLVNISGFHVDPGYYGRLLFAVFNAGPNDVPLRYNERAFMVMFNKLAEEIPEETTAVIKGRWHGMENIPVETLSGLTGTSVSVRNLDERIKRLEMIYPALGAGIASIAIAVITWILTHW
jgi:dCTP deaminase